MLLVILTYTNVLSLLFFFVFFFFQAEDGIRYWSVTGVQTCALPIFLAAIRDSLVPFPFSLFPFPFLLFPDCGQERLSQILSLSRADAPDAVQLRSEERRVGKECRSRW